MGFQPLLRGGALAAATLLIVAALTAGASSPARAASPPAVTTTRYVSNPDPSRFWTLGCNDGTYATYNGPQNGVVILVFGQPMTWNGGSTFGTYDFGNHLDSTATITAVAEGYLKGWWDCTPKNGPTVRLGVGTSNYKGSTTYAHGKAWALMVNDINNWIVNNRYGSQLYARGANDMEISWNSASATRAWVDGYNAAADYPLYDYGDAENGVDSANGWTAEDVWYKAYGAPQNWPIPEIYYTANATRNWQPISLWAYKNKGRPIYFLGVLTQYAADPDTLSPSQGWLALYNALNSDTRTAQQDIPYLTDITWRN